MTTQLQVIVILMSKRISFLTQAHGYETPQLLINFYPLKFYTSVPSTSTLLLFLAVINTGNGDDSLDYHAASVDPSDGTILRNVAFQLTNIPNARIDNTAFW